VDLSTNSDRLFVAFGSLRLEKEVPPFEYVRTLNNLPVKRVFIRDLRKIFYLRGLPGISDDLIGIRDYLQDIRERESIEKLVIVGGSAGGYAALLMGWLMAADEVYVFSPITYLPTRKGLEWLELLYGRNWRLIWTSLQTRFDSRIPRWHYDLRNVLTQDNGRTRYHIYYGGRNEKDVVRCQRMAGLPGVQLYKYDWDTHHIDRYLQQTGEWQRIFRDAVAL
jgi:hypothetical protein